MSSSASAPGAPRTLEEYTQFALSLQRSNKPFEAAQAYITILRQVPKHWPSYYNLGIVFQQLKRLEDARIAYERAVEINPQLAQGFNNLGIVLQALDRQEDAATAYQRALALDPALSQAQFNLAMVQQGKGRFTDSTISLRQAVDANPKDDNAWDALYRALLGLKRQEEAVTVFLEWEAAVVRSPLLTAAGLAQCRYMADPAREEKYLKLATEWPFQNAAVHELAPIIGMLQYFDVEPADMLRTYQRFDDAVRRSSPRQVALLPQRSAGKKLRIGYVSADFRRHVMGRIMLDVIREHDRERFSVHLVSLTEAVHSDAATMEFVAMVDSFVDISKLTDYEAARTIATLDLDVLVDLAGQTAGARPIVYAHRPARKIVTHLGYHGCIGMSGVDFKVTDRVADSVDGCRYQLEKPLFLDGCLFPFVHMEASPEDKQQYANTRSTGEFVFGVFVNVLKLSPRCLRAWKAILDQSPAAVLAFSPLRETDKPAIFRATASVGIPPDRLRFIPIGTTESAQRARYAAVDVVLDTFPYTGGDTTLAALDCDVPVVTLAGQRNAERVGASLLTHLGITEAIARDEHEYIDCASRLANDPDWFEIMRIRFSQARTDSAFAKVSTHTRALEAAFTAISCTGHEEQSTLTAIEFFARLDALVRRHQSVQERATLYELDREYAELRLEQPDYAPLLRIHAAIKQSLGDDVQSLQLLRHAHRAHSGDPEIAVALVDRLIETVHFEEASNVIATTIPFAPNNAQLLTARARLLLRRGDPQAAIAVCEEVIAHTPTDAVIRLLHANALAESGQPRLALSAFHQVLSLEPSGFEANYNAGLLALECGEFVFAETALRKAVDARPTHELAQLKLAEVLFAQQKTDAWVGLVKRIGAAFPRSTRAALARAEAWRFEGELLREAAEFRNLAESLLQEPDHLLVEEVGAQILRRRSAVALDDQLADALARSHEAAVCAIHARVAQSSRAVDADRPPRIGMLLDVGTNLLRASLRLRFATAFAQSFDENSGVQVYLLDRLSAGNSESPVASRSIAGFNATRAAETIAQDNIDVLFDLVGVRHHLAPAILAHRPAPIVIAQRAFADVFDELECVDFEAFDEWTALPQWQARGPTRPMLRLTSLLPATLSSVVPNKGETNRRPFVYATLAAIEEIPHASLLLWKDILTQAPDSRFAVPADCDSALRTYHRLLQSVGIGASRITSFSPDAVRAGRPLEGIDLILDSISCNTGMATAMALDLGCAVVTMRGPSAVERVSYSVLARRNLPELVAESPKDYVKIAVRMCTDAAFRAGIQTRMREPLKALPTGVDLAALRAALAAKVTAARSNSER